MLLHFVRSVAVLISSILALLGILHIVKIASAVASLKASLSRTLSSCLALDYFHLVCELILLSILGWNVHYLRLAILTADDFDACLGLLRLRNACLIVVAVVVHIVVVVVVVLVVPLIVGLLSDDVGRSNVDDDVALLLNLVLVLHEVVNDQVVGTSGLVLHLLHHLTLRLLLLRFLHSAARLLNISGSI